MAAAAQAVASATEQLTKSLSETVENSGNVASTSDANGVNSNLQTLITTSFQKALESQKELLESAFNEMTTAINKILVKSHESLPNSDGSEINQIESQLDAISKKCDENLRILEQNNIEQVQKINIEINEIKTFRNQLTTRINELETRIKDISTPNINQGQAETKQNELLDHLKKDMFPDGFFERMLKLMEKIANKSPATQVNIMEKS